MVFRDTDMSYEPDFDHIIFTSYRKDDINNLILYLYLCIKPYK